MIFGIILELHTCIIFGEPVVPILFYTVKNDMNVKL